MAINYKVSSDIDTFLRKSTKEDAATFLGLEDTKAQWGQITGTLSTQTDLQSALDAKASSSDVSTNTSNISTNTSNISTNTSNIATNTSDIATNTSNISTQGVAISNNASDISTNTSNIALKAPIASPTFTGTVIAPVLKTSEVQAVSGEAIEYDAIEHRFRDEDEQPSNLLVIKKTDGVPIGKVGINHTNPKVALHIVGGHVASGGITDEALRVVGSALLTSTNASTLVLAMDTDNTSDASTSILKIKRDESTSETSNVEEMNLGFIGSAGDLYTNSTENSAYLIVENNKSLEIATGSVPVKRMEVSSLGISSSGPVKVGLLTNDAKNAMVTAGTAENGMIIYNSDEDTFQGFADGGWTDLSG